MKSQFFCGIPHTPYNVWEVQTAPLPPTGPDGNRGSPNFSVDVHDLKFYADFYNEHHACCWPRTVLDAHLGNAAREIGRVPAASELAADAECPTHSRSTLRGDDVAAAAASPVLFYTAHAAAIMEQLHAAQQGKLPRAAHARRALFHRSVPPVLRCHENNDAFVYMITGQLRLLHRFRGEGLRQVPALDPTTATTAAEALARGVFPLVLVMAPSEDCAAFVDAEAPVAAAATQWRTQPQVLALESVTAVPSPWSRGEAVDDGQLWCAAYTPFKWVCNPLGNDRVSVLVTSAAAMQRMPRVKPRRTAVASARAQVAGSCATTSLEPLRLSFSVYASQYASVEVRERLLRALVASDVYSLHVTKSLRFGLGGADVRTRAVLGVDKVALLHARSRRSAQLMRLLDDKLEVVTEAPPQPALGGADSHPTLSAAESAARRSGGPPPPRKVHRREGSVELAASVDGRENRSRSLVPSVTTHRIAQLSTARPIPREWCQLPKSTTLASILPQRARESDDAAHSGWPLHVVCDLDGVECGAVVELTALQTLQDLAAALRAVSS